LRHQREQGVRQRDQRIEAGERAEVRGERGVGSPAGIGWGGTLDIALS
jgi:hypothetical protein